MQNHSTERPFKRIPGWIKGLGLTGAALGIAGVVWLSNPAEELTGSCAANPEAAARIDAAAQGELAALLATASGRSYAQLPFEDETGRELTLEDFSGKPLLVNFWATWCVPCREEMPALDALAARYAPEIFEVVPINLDVGADGTEKARKFLAEYNLSNLRLLADPSYKAFEQLKKNGVAIGLPATLLLDAKGCEMAVLQGPAAWDSPDGIKTVDSLIALAAKP